MRSRNRIVAVLVALGAAALGGAAVAQTSSNVQGIAGVGSSGSYIRPVVTGGLDGSGNVIADVADTVGKRVHGVTTSGGALTNVRPVVIGANDGSLARYLLSDTSGRLYVTGTMFGVGGATDTVTRVTPTASNGATRVTIGPAGSASLVVYALTLVFSNSGASARTVTVSTASTADCLSFILPASTGGFVLDGRGDIRSNASEALQFRLDGGTTEVTVSGAVVQK